MSPKEVSAGKDEAEGEGSCGQTTSFGDISSQLFSAQASTFLISPQMSSAQASASLISPRPFSADTAFGDFFLRTFFAEDADFPGFSP